ncbi:MAG: YraN family protein [Alphaproteobacteria bacterium]|nr:YraN family protein [Alphaproteobacteria bacterium]MBL0717802.1 YraN family protein [Alphaproteobacteria bacterium]
MLGIKFYRWISGKPFTSYEFGIISEHLAGIYLFFKGYTIVSRRYSGKRGYPTGEVDLIAYHKKTLIFVEIKKRKTLNLASESISPRQRYRIRKSYHLFTSRHPRFKNYGIRFDTILFGKDLLKPRHIKNAF